MMKDVSASGRTVLFVSHNMAAVGDLCSTAIMLKTGQIQLMGNLQEVINCYLDNHTGNSAVFELGPLRRVSLEQQGRELLIEADYVAPQPLSMPALGFVISDMMGRPICGANPRLANHPPLERPSRSGAIRATMRQPRLLDGSYRLSVWFGDQHQDFVSHLDCLTFSVAGMAGARQLPTAVVGPVYPECDWIMGIQPHEECASFVEPGA
jgi:lipopolysaccharide transport system ATP-binding protein